MAGTSSGQSSTRSNGRYSTMSKPMSMIFTTVNRPSAMPPAMAAGLRNRSGSSTSTSTPMRPSSGTRRNASKENFSRSLGAMSTNNTNSPARTVAVRRSNILTEFPFPDPMR